MHNHSDSQASYSISHTKHISYPLSPLQSLNPILYYLHFHHALFSKMNPPPPILFSYTNPTELKWLPRNAIRPNPLVFIILIPFIRQAR